MIFQKRKNVFVITIFLGILVFFATTYFFIDPAQSRTAQDAITCQLEEHIHTAECFAPYAEDYSDKILICGVMAEDGSVSHIHDSFCYDGMNDLICPAEEYVHTHDESCYNENNEQICGITVHQHSEQCFSDTVNREDYRMLVCSQQAHIHRDSCYELNTQEEIVLSEDTQTENYDIQPLNANYEEQEVYGAVNDVELYTLDTSNAINLSEPGNADYIDNITVSYQDSGKWIRIDQSDGNNVSLPADADYRLEVSYKDISIDTLKAQHYGKLMLTGIPNWLKPDANGKILLNSVPVATMQVQGGTLLIEFEDKYLNDHSGDTLSGTFFVRGSVDWRRLNNSVGTIDLPKLNMTIHFEDDLPQKYGDLSITKEDPQLVPGDNGTYYLKYEVTVNSLESEIAIPDVTVVDSFTGNAGYITEYCGITESVRDLRDPGSGFDPIETRPDNAAAGTVVKIAGSKSMRWNIGELGAGEERKLTYYAKLDPSFIGSFSKGSIVNSAETFSSDTPKGSDSGEFIPRADAWIEKTLADANVDDDNGTGTGTLTYKVKISADQYNSYDLTNLTLHDYIDSKFSGFAEYPGTITAVSNMSGMTAPTVANHGATSFDVNIPTLRPGEVITVTYVMNVENILLSGTGTIDFINKAQLIPNNNGSSGAAPGYVFSSSQDHQTFRQSQWVRKLDGGNLETDTTVAINSGNGYDFNGSSIVSADPPPEFTVPAGDKKYQVVLNEEGRWDLSSAALKDHFNAGSGIIYKGWLCIQEFKQPGIQGQLNDPEVIDEIGKLTPYQTVWLNIDGRTEFSFMPNELGLTDHNSTYLLTYYAGIQNAASAGTVSITNNFEVNGTIGVGGVPYHINGIKVSVSSLVQGNIHYNVHKDSWYYSEYPNEETGVSINNPDEYGNGAIYWVIKVDGDVNQGFSVKDVIQNTNDVKWHWACSDSIAGVYRGKKDLDFTKEFHSYSEMRDNVGSDKKLQALVGNPVNLGYNPSVVYNKVDVNNISELNGESFVIANFNWHPGVVTNQFLNENPKGLAGNMNIHCQNNNDPPITSADELTQWKFEKVNNDASDKRFYVSTNVNGKKQYMSISGGDSFSSGQGDVSLSDEAVELYISQSEGYPGKVKIANEHGMALNWYGWEGYYIKFSGYKANGDDINDFHTLLEASNVYSTDDYSWFADSSNDGIEVCFQKDMNLADDEALYIVVRTSPTYKPEKGWNSGRYKNGAASKNSGSSASEWAPANNSEFILKTATPVYKEGIKAYRYDGSQWLNLEGEDSAHLEHLIGSHVALKSGTYVEWIINVNYDGSMEGLAEISDIIPENLTPAFVGQHWLGNGISGDQSMHPTYPIIPELEADRNWTKMETATIPAYYNPTTRELRFCVDNLQKESDPLAVNSKTVNIQLFCKVDDPNILLSGITKSVNNTVTATNNGNVNKSTDSVDISPQCSLTKKFGGTVESGKTGDDKLNFVIEVNPCGETLGRDDVLPPLIDEFENISIIESSLQIKENDEKGRIISGYTYDIEENRLTINKLPDNKKLYITYFARTTSAPDMNNDIHVSNRAYWEGHEPPQAWQVSDLIVDQSMGGKVNTEGSPKAIIYKVDSADRTVGLKGAVFALYQYNGNGSGELIDSGTTGDDGKVTFDPLSYNTVYYITETTAPEGYQRSTEMHYFVILDNEKPNYNNVPTNITGLDKWDSKRLGNEYECVIENSKEKIRVNKSFKDEKTGAFVPESGKFSFGIFDVDPVGHPQAKPLQILEIEYVNRERHCKLDGKPEAEPEFTIAQPNEYYYVFELDGSQKPIFNGGYLSTRDNYFKVVYRSGSGSGTPDNMVTISPGHNTISIENQVAYFTMPEAGGMGLKKYYLFAGVFAVSAVLIFLRIKRKFAAE